MSTPRLLRTLFELQRPEIPYGEQELAALLSTSLNASTKPSNLLILAAPGDGSSTLGIEMEDKIRAITISDFSFARLAVDDGTIKNFPWVVQALMGEQLKSPFFRMRMSWDSLNISQKIAYGGGYLIYIVAFNLASLCMIAWSKGEAITPEAYSLFQLKNFISAASVTMLGAVLAAVAVAYWKSLWRSLSEGDLDAHEDELMSVIKRNGFRVLIQAFRRRFIRGYGPVLLWVDSVDDLSASIDNDFFYHHLLPFLKRWARVVLVAVSKFPAEERLKFCDTIENLRIFSLDSLGIEDLACLTSQPLSHSLTIKEALGLGFSNVDKLRRIRRQISILESSYVPSEGGSWTIFCLLSSAPHFDRRGFTQRSLEEAFRGNIEVLHPAKGASLISTGKVHELFNNLFQTDAAKDWFIFNEREGAYFWDGLARREVMSRSEPSWRLLGGLLWLSALFREFERSQIGWKIFEMEKLARQLNEHLLGEEAEAVDVQVMLSLATDILSHFRRSSYADLRRAFGILYFVARSKVKDASGIKSEDVAALEALILCNPITLQALGKLVEDIERNGEVPAILKLLVGSLSGNKDVYETALADISAALESSDAELKVAFRWLLLECQRQHQIIPATVVAELPESWQGYIQQIPSITGGFNLSTLPALYALADAVELGDEGGFVSAWFVIAEGIIKMSHLQPTSWELLWLEYISLVLVSEIVSFYSMPGGSRIYDQEGFRRDISLDYLSDDQYSLLRGIGEIIGLYFTDHRLSVVPVSSLKELGEIFDGMRLKCLVLSLRELAAALDVYKSKFVFRVMSFNDLPMEVREEILSDLQRVASRKPSVHRRALPLEAMIQLYRIHSLLHKSLSSETILAIIRKLEEFGCSDGMISALYDKYIQELRFSHDVEKAKLAVRMLLKRVRQKPFRSFVKISKIYCILASDLLKLGGKRGAEICLKRAKRFLDRHAGHLSDEYSLSQFRDAELQIFVEEIRIKGLHVDDIRKMINFLVNPEYGSAGNSFLLLLWLASEHLPLEKLGYLAEAVRASRQTDWYAGYIWSLILQRLVRRLVYPGEYGLILSAIEVVIGKLELSDKNGIDFTAAIEDLRYLKGQLLRLGDEFNAMKVGVLCEDLMVKHLAVIYREAMEIWAESGALGEIAYAYYRLLAPYVEERLPRDLIVWSADADYDSFREAGVAHLADYMKVNDKTAWLAIYVVGQLERRARQQNDDSLRYHLQGIWLQIGMNCLDSLFQTTITSSSLPVSIRSLLRQQLDGLSKGREVKSTA